MTHWYEIAPADAVDIDVSKRDDIIGPLDEMGEECPWPWDPQQLGGAPMGMYHCPYCGTMCVAGMPHPDYRDEGDDEQVAEDLCPHSGMPLKSCKATDMCDCFDFEQERG